MNVKPTLMILAAGMGSRYGGLKQIDPVGPNGETIMDYSVYDALRAGFDKLVFVIRRDIEQAFREKIGSRFATHIKVDYAFQELSDVPGGFELPPGRQKPWGTGHAMLAGRKVIKEPFAVVNADDFYGQQSFALLAEHLRSGSQEAAMVGFVLENTLSEFGTVARGVCRTDNNGYLAAVEEMTAIERADGLIRCVNSQGAPATLSGNDIVSLNTWGFHPRVLELFLEEFRRFLANRGTDPKAEFYIPTAVNDLLVKGALRLKVLRTPDSWFGVTYREDKPRVTESIQQLISRGDYPSKLWDGLR